MQNNRKPSRKTSRGEVVSSSSSNTLTVSIPSTSIRNDTNSSSSNPAQDTPYSQRSTDSQPHSSNYDTPPRHKHQHQTSPISAAQNHHFLTSPTLTAAEDHSNQISVDISSMGPLNNLEEARDKKSTRTTLIQLNSWVYETSNRKLVMSEVLEKARWEGWDAGSSSDQERCDATWKK